MTDEPRVHRPVLVDAVVDLIGARRGGAYVDATAGAGGHTSVLLRAGADRVLTLDADPAAVRALQTSFADDDRVTAAHGNFRGLASLAPAHGFPRADGVLMDLGVSWSQLDAAQRGFSFRLDGPIDMRLNPTRGRPAGAIVNELPEHELAALIWQYGDERRSRQIARRIVDHRPLTTTRDLARVVAGALPGRHRIHPATRTFQALRIATNDELGALDQGLDGALDLMAPDGRIVTIAFHSLEDRIVKKRFRAWARAGTAELITRKIVRPSRDEVAANPRSSSARLRAVRVPELA